MNKFEKAGSVIYGAQRLYSALEGLIEWFSKEMEGEKNGPVGLERAAINYFEKNNTSQDIRQKFIKIKNEITIMERNSKDLLKKESDELDSSLTIIRDLHFSLAQLFDDIGYSGIPSSLLRQRGLLIQ